MLIKTTLIAAAVAIGLTGAAMAMADGAKAPTILDDQALDVVIAGTSNPVGALESVVVELNDSDALFLTTPNLCSDGNPCSDTLYYGNPALDMTYGGDACDGSEDCNKHPVFYTTIGGDPEEIDTNGATPPTYAPAAEVIEFGVLPLF
ncbi:hypothetical protein [Halomonas aquatica]|uniref:Uncharacterized protein n=1 Tax=Halomonas aquatica TaxID=3151123 RepID=A0ABV1NI23_9GAMM